MITEQWMKQSRTYYARRVTMYNPEQKAREDDLEQEQIEIEKLEIQRAKATCYDE